MSAHVFSARDGIGTVRANFARTPDQIAESEQRRQQSERVIAEHHAAIEAREQAKIKAETDAVNLRTIWGAWTPDQIEELRHLRREMKYTATKIAAHFGITYSAAKSAIERHSNPETMVRRRAAQAEVAAVKKAAKKPYARKPKIKARQVNEKVARKCLQCGKAFVAPTRFIRLCRSNCQGGE